MVRSPQKPPHYNNILQSFPNHSVNSPVLDIFAHYSLSYHFFMTLYKTNQLICLSTTVYSVGIRLYRFLYFIFFSLSFSLCLRFCRSLFIFHVLSLSLSFSLAVSTHSLLLSPFFLSYKRLAGVYWYNHVQLVGNT
jgi:hypothetical protein